MDEFKRIPAGKMAKIFAKHIRNERPNYEYLKTVFRCLRKELGVHVTKKPKKLPYVPTEEDVQKYYEVVWQARNMQDMLIIKTLLYTGVRVSELVNITLESIDLKQCQIRIKEGKGKKDRIVPFPVSFREVLAMHVGTLKQKRAFYLFESLLKRKYTERGIRRILEKYSRLAGLKHIVSPHKLRHFLFTWLKKKGIDDALIQPYSGHETRKSLEIYSKLSIGEAQKEYNKVINSFPV